MSTAVNAAAQPDAQIVAATFAKLHPKVRPTDRPTTLPDETTANRDSEPTEQSGLVYAVILSCA